MAQKKSLEAHPPSLNKYIGLSIKAHRKQAKLTQAQLGERVGTSQQIIAAIEKGLSKRSVFIPEVCRVLGLDIESTMFTDAAPPVIDKNTSRFSEDEFTQLEQMFTKALRVLGEFNELHHKPFIPADDIQSTVALLVQQVRDLADESQ